MGYFAYLLVMLSLVLTLKANPTCIDENGDPVDMFIIYKLPKVKGSTVPHVSKGAGFIYLDSNSQQFRLGKTAITDESSPTGRTLNQVYKSVEDENMAYAFYNDQPPKSRKAYSSNGHTKGALAFNMKSGFWLIHSVPRFPAKAEDGYEYPHSGLTYGQTMICVTFDSNQFERIAEQLIYNHPRFQSKHLPDVFRKEFPTMRQLLVKGKQIKHDPFSHVTSLRSSGGIPFLDFAKDNQYKQDLYRDFVAVVLQTGLLTETWQHGTDIGASCKSQFHVEDIDRINIEVAKGNVNFKSMKDHSKFAIGKTKERPFVCIGDINRQPSQFHRGGGTLCFKNIKIWEQYAGFVDDVKGC